MAFQPVPGVYEVEVRGTNLGQRTANTFYYAREGAATESEATLIADTVALEVLSQWGAQLPTSWTGVEVFVRDLAVEIAVQATSGLIAGMLGTVVGQPAASLITLAIARRSGFTGRSARGRIFWQAFSEAQLDGNLVGSGEAAAILLMIKNLDLAVQGAGAFTPVIVSRYNGGVKRPTGIALPIAQWLLNDTEQDTRRSRKPKGG